MNRMTLCVCAPAFLGAFDFGLLALAAPRVADELGAAGPAYPWLFSISSFTYGALVLPAAALIGWRGPARALVLGLIVTACGMAAFAAAAGLAAALVGRATFGGGGAVAATAALALLSGARDERTRRAGIAAVGGAVGAGFATGALLSAISPWRAVLVAIALLSLLVASAARRIPAEDDQCRARMPGGSVLLAAGVVIAAAALARRDPVATLPGLAVAALLMRSGLRRASKWLPRQRRLLGSVCLAAAATTASGVTATILAGAAFADGAAPEASLGAFGLAVAPGAWFAGAVASYAGHPAAAATGLAIQAVALAGLSAALVADPAWPLTTASIVAFGVGHVAANAGAAGAVATLAGPGVPAVGALLVAAQYLGGAVAPVLIAGRADTDGSEPRGVLVAAIVALIGVLVLVASAGGLTRFQRRVR